MSEYQRDAMNAGGIKTSKTNKIKTTWPRQPSFHPAIEPSESVESDDLSRFEGEGGLEAPVLSSSLIDVPLENAVWRRQRRPEDQRNSAVL